MKQRFDLFKLHDPNADKDPKWSWIRGSGSALGSYIRSLMKELTVRHGTNSITARIAKEIPKLATESVRDYFWSPNMTRFPLVFLEVLSKQFDNSEEIKQGIQKKIEILSISRWDSKPIKAVKELDLTLCKIAGAHAADGALWGEYNIELIDADYGSVNEFCNWLYEVFGYRGVVKRHKYNNAYYVCFKSRIIGRYLNRILGFPIGKKSCSVREPPIIKESYHAFRKAFALGVMTFDGSVTNRGAAAIQSMSKGLILDLCDIFKEDGIFVMLSEQPDRSGRHTLQFRPRDHKLIGYFDQSSGKYKRAYASVYGYQGSVKTSEEARGLFDVAYPKTPNSVTSFSEIIEVAELMGRFSSQDVSNVLAWLGASISQNSVTQYLRTLLENRILVVISRGSRKRVLGINTNIVEWRIPVLTSKM